MKFGAFSQNIKTVSNWWNREKPASPVPFLSADPSLSISSSSDQESKDSQDQNKKEDARPQNLDESKDILDKRDQKD